MNIDTLRQEIADDEGCVNSVYLDHLGLETCGVGHLILESDPEFGKPIGTDVSEERVRQLFALDIAVTVEDCKILYPTWDSMSDELHHILCNLMFNMGRPRMSKFKKFIAAIESEDYEIAGAELKDSRYYEQVTNRADRLIDRLHMLAIPF